MALQGPRAAQTTGRSAEVWQPHYVPKEVTSTARRWTRLWGQLAGMLLWWVCGGKDSAQVPGEQLHRLGWLRRPGLSLMPKGPSDYLRNHLRNHCTTSHISFPRPRLQPSPHRAQGPQQPHRSTGSLSTLLCHQDCR